MKTVGIIAEYNPFHNGHLYQIQEAKRLAHADCCVVVMSGSFVQRGTPAFLDKMNRTKMALENGADLVLELPVRYATGSAEYFSTGAVSLLHNLGFVDSICFGSESGNINKMKKIANYIQKDCDDFNNSVVEFVKSGYSYPKSRQKALEIYCKELDREEVKDIISSPNNILGIEYLKALTKTQSHMTAFTVKRKQTGYHDTSLEMNISENFNIHSATAIRKSIENIKSIEGNLRTERAEVLEPVKTSMPISVFHILSTLTTYPIQMNDLSNMLYYKLAISDMESLCQYQDVTHDLARSIKNNFHSFESFEQYIDVLKTKQYTYTRISRSLLHILLQIPKYDLHGKQASEIVPYARVLGFRREASILLKEAKKCSSIPIVTKMADAKHILSEDAYQMLSEDIFATDLYYHLVFQTFGFKGKNDIQTSPILL